MNEELLDPPETTKPKRLRNMKVTAHAERRFAQRFPLLVMWQEWEAAKRCGRRLVKLIRQEQLKKGGRPEKDVTYYQSPAGPVFVVKDQGPGRKPALVTVLPNPKLSTRNDMEV